MSQFLVAELLLVKNEQFSLHNFHTHKTVSESLCGLFLKYWVSEKLATLFKPPGVQNCQQMYHLQLEGRQDAFMNNVNCFDTGFCAEYIFWLFYYCALYEKKFSLFTLF